MQQLRTFGDSEMQQRKHPVVGAGNLGEVARVLTDAGQEAEGVPEDLETWRWW
jgi:hypothetical protein